MQHTSMLQETKGAEKAGALFSPSAEKREQATELREDYMVGRTVLHKAAL